MSKSHRGPGLGSGSAPADAIAGQGHGGPGSPGMHGAHGFLGLGDVFSFTIVDAMVTAASVKLPSGSTLTMPLNTGVIYSVSGADVLATRTDANATRLVQYSDTDADGLYEVIASSQVFTSAPLVNMLGFSQREALSVTLDGASLVTGVTQTRWDGTEKVLLSATVLPTDTTWAIKTGLLVETHTQINGQTHWEVFRDGNADGNYTEVASGTGALIDLVGVVTQTDAVATLL